MLSAVRHISFNATKTVAASELPPPKPPPAGMRFSTSMSAPWLHLVAI
jgi:hypothetical protein